MLVDASTRSAARLLLIEAEAIRPILDATPPAHFDRPTVCEGWSVRDVLAHCASALTRTAGDDLHGFTPAENERDVDERRGRTLEIVIAELFSGYEGAAAAIDAAGGALDGIGLGEWIHGGDVREALAVGTPYVSGGVSIAVELAVERSRAQGRPRLDLLVDGTPLAFGSGDEVVGSVDTDLETFVRLCGGRRPDPGRFRATNCGAADFVLFS